MTTDERTVLAEIRARHRKDGPFGGNYYFDKLRLDGSSGPTGTYCCWRCCNSESHPEGQHGCWPCDAIRLLDMLEALYEWCHG